MKTINKKYLYLLMFAWILWPGILLAQQHPIAQPPNGTAAPAFRLKVTVPNQKETKTMQVSDFSGRWLVLDFWTRSCIACIEAMPKLDKLRKQFTGKIDFLMVGKNDTKYGTGIEKLYQRIASSENLQLLAAFDTVSFESYGVRNTPHVAIIDPSGMLYASTVSQWLTEESLQELIDGKKPYFPPMNWGQGVVRSEMTSRYLRPSTLGVRDGEGYRSKLSPWKRADGFQKALMLDSFANKPVYRTATTTLSNLYLVSAFGRAEWRIGTTGYGETWPRPVLQLSDTSLFISQSQREQGIYNYEISRTDIATGTAGLQRLISTDLARRFGYKARVEQREMPVLELVTLDQPRVGSLASSKPFSSKGDAAGYKIEGASATDLIRRIGYYFPRTLLYDRSGISGRIDLTIDASMISLTEIRTALNAHGLDLRPTLKSVPVLVISDR